MAYANSHVSRFVGSGVGIWAVGKGFVKANCGKVVKLSGVLQGFLGIRDVVENVHGIRNEFLMDDNEKATSSGVYFIGKLLWAKGLDRMLELQEYYKRLTGDYFEVDIYGSGPDGDDIKRAYLGRKKTGSKKKRTINFKDIIDKIKSKEMDIGTQLPRSLAELRRSPIRANFRGSVDHAELKNKYRIYVNPSVSEVLCTTAAEAVGMGMWVILPKHESNVWFEKFDNVLTYRDKLEFCGCLAWARNRPPPKLSSEIKRELSWEAATDRLIEVAKLSPDDVKEEEKNCKMEERLGEFFQELGKGERGDLVRKVLGGGVVADQVKFEVERRRYPKVSSEGDEIEGHHNMNSSLLHRECKGKQNATMRGEETGLVDG